MDSISIIDFLTNNNFSHIQIPKKIKNNILHTTIRNIIKNFHKNTTNTYTIKKLSSIKNSINHKELPLVAQFHKVTKKTYHQFTQNYKLNITKFTKPFYETQIPFILNDILYNNNFMPLSIQHYVESTQLDHFTINIYNEMTNGHHKINIFAPTIKDYDIDEITQKISLIFHIMHRLSSKIKDRIMNNITCTIILTPITKSLTLDDSGIYTSENVNSACCMPGEYIYIWRTEEIYKVIIHELVHYYKLDIDIFINDTINFGLLKYSDKYFTEHQPELFTESLALLINSIIISTKYNTKLEDILLYEINFSYFQILKIINQIKNNTNYQLKQLTSIRAYYIFKLLALYNMKNFIDITNLLFLKPMKKTGISLKLIETINKNHQILSKYIINDLNNYKENEKNKKIYDTGRMSIFEL
jgi:hypothetical protein